MVPTNLTTEIGQIAILREVSAIAEVDCEAAKESTEGKEDITLRGYTLQIRNAVL